MKRITAAEAKSLTNESGKVSLDRFYKLIAFHAKLGRTSVSVSLDKLESENFEFIESQLKTDGFKLKRTRGDYRFCAGSYDILEISW